MAGRSEQRAKDAITLLDKEGREPGLGEVIFHELDLKDPRDAKASAERFMERETKLDVLINNAALIAGLGKPTKNNDGVQDNMATKYALNYTA
ncbi:hypothetical protein H0H81_004988 [Sphagnurus paluster]|uniref:Uncharacterized protein n=1 Tax=Sphagnurus paluster TaxID=117069 RepID=A0A9P7GMC5_9AGAR|nr:hypothetical protein H0H81_004988 [Sphagnurus paluster]